MSLADQLIREIDQRRDDLVSLTRDFLKMPTLNPPKGNCREICDDLAVRSNAAGFEVEFVRACGAPGDSGKLGIAVKYVVSPGAYGQKHFDRIRKLKNYIAYGPGILDLAHKPDEYAEVEDMLDSAKVMGRSPIGLLAKP